MKNALILHGAGNDSQGNWFPWLRSELEKKGYRVWVPDLPNSDTPILTDWIKTIFDNKDWAFNNESVVIGHSAGATMILRVLEHLPEGVQIDKAILVSGYVNKGAIPEYFKYKEGLLKTPFNWEKIRQSCQNFYFIASDNDPYQCGEENSIIFQKNLGGELIIKKGQGHFNLEISTDYKEFPLLLSLIG